jgi:antitoxin HigA-1
MPEELSVTLLIAREPTHPGELIGEVLEEHFHFSIPDAAARMGVTRQALHAVVSGRSAVSPEMAPRFGKLVDGAPELYIAMQGQRDLWLAQQRLKRGAGGDKNGRGLKPSALSVR